MFWGSFGTNWYLDSVLNLVVPGMRIQSGIMVLLGPYEMLPGLQQLRSSKPDKIGAAPIQS